MGNIDIINHISLIITEDPDVFNGDAISEAENPFAAPNFNDSSNRQSKSDSPVDY